MISLPVLALVLAGLVVSLAAVIALTGRTRRQAAVLAREAAVEELALRASQQDARPPAAEAKDLASLAEEVRRLAEAGGRRDLVLGRLEEAAVAEAGRLEALETAYAESRQTIQGLGERLDGALQELATRVESLGPPDGEAADASPRERIRLWLEAEGFREIVLLEDPAAEASFAVEARRGTLAVKGRATLDDAGQVEARLAPAARSFP